MIRGLLEQENQQLKQQLAEKDEEIEKYRNANMIVLGGRSQGKKHLMEIKIKELQNQKAIEQLEKVREKFGYKHNLQLVVSSKQLVEFIDQQINELKGEIK